jgi:hypothetical protein
LDALPVETVLRATQRLAKQGDVSH